MRRWARRSIRARLTAIIFAGTAAASITLIAAATVAQVGAIRTEVLERTILTARLVGEQCVSPLAFGDLPGAQRVLASLGAYPAVVLGRLVDEEGKVAASFDRASAPPPPASPPAPGGHRFEGRHLVVHHEIVLDGTRYGSLVVVASTAEVWTRVRSMLGSAALALAAVLAASWLLARRLHKGLSARILALADAMARVSRERDYAVRAPEGGDDEIAALARGFNGMLGEIRQHQAEREEAQARLARLGTAVEHAGDEVLITDAAGIVQYVNPEFTRVTGYAADEVVARPISALGATITDDQTADLLAATRSGRAWTGRVRTARKDGAVLVEDATVSPIPGLAGEVLGYVVVRRDVTERLRLERQLGQTQKMEALGTLAGGIAHDFNNILTAMIGLTEAARSEAPRGSSIAESLEEVQRAGHRAAGLVRQILTFGRRTEEERRPLPVGPVVKEALTLLRASLPASVELRSEIDEIPCVRANPTEIHQVVMNLATNAALAMKGRGGRIDVKVEPLEIDEPFAAARPGLRPGSAVRITVADDGPGIDPEIRDRIFEPFFTTRSVGEGTGLGLSVVHGIVTGLGGHVAVQSDPGHGAAFHVFLPRSVGGPVAEAPPRPREPGGTERVLVVDDEPVLVRVATRVLERHGYTVSGHVSAREALGAFVADPSGFDLLVTDLTMPGMGGDQLAREIRALRPDLPIVVCTGFGDGPDAARLREVGVDACAAKPYTADSLAAVVRQVLDARRGAADQNRQSTPSR